MESFIKIGPSVWAVEMTHTHRHTHRQTDRQTDTLASIATYSVKLTEYKKKNGKKRYNEKLQKIDKQNFDLC